MVTTVMSTKKPHYSCVLVQCIEKLRSLWKCNLLLELMSLELDNNDSLPPALRNQ